jgi:two-component system, OmpR family, phosphate regulon sensor histidine kinase PhoR
MNDLARIIEHLRHFETVGIAGLYCTPDAIIELANRYAATLFHAENLQGTSLEEVQGGQVLIELLKDLPTQLTTCEVCLHEELYCRVRLLSVDDGCLILLEDLTEYYQREKFQLDSTHTVVHDLKAPLSVIKGYANLIPQLGQVNPQQHQFLDRIQSAADNMVRLINDLLDLTWIDAHKPIDPTKYRPEFLVQTALDGLHTTLKNRHIQCTTEYAENLPQITGDSKRLQRAINHVIGNAVNFSRHDGKIWVRVYPAEAEILCIEVQDEGVGIAPESLPYIFERFFRIPNPEEEISGNGLGLAIVKGVVERHGGTVVAESIPETGSTFRIYLPVEA